MLNGKCYLKFPDLFFEPFPKEYGLNRETRRFMNIQFSVDKFHESNHTSCGKTFNSSEYVSLRDKNSQACEQVNAKLRTIATTCTFMNPDMFMRSYLCISPTRIQRTQSEVVADKRLICSSALSAINASSRFVIHFSVRVTFLPRVLTDGSTFFSIISSTFSSTFFVLSCESAFLRTFSSTFSSTFPSTL